jgi:hypothetical protein
VMARSLVILWGHDSFLCTICRCPHRVTIMNSINKQFHCAKDWPIIPGAIRAQPHGTMAPPSRSRQGDWSRRLVPWPVAQPDRRRAGKDTAASVSQSGMRQPFAHSSWQDDKGQYHSSHTTLQLCFSVSCNCRASLSAIVTGSHAVALPRRSGGG